MKTWGSAGPDPTLQLRHFLPKREQAHGHIRGILCQSEQKGNTSGPSANLHVCTDPEVPATRPAGAWGGLAAWAWLATAWSPALAPHRS